MSWGLSVGTKSGQRLADDPRPIRSTGQPPIVPTECAPCAPVGGKRPPAPARGN
jgi:hypothetical protein